MASTFRKRWGLAWDIHGDGKTITPGEVVKPHERLAAPQTIGIGLQHVMAMFGSTVLVPALTGFPPTAALFFSGVGTLLFLVITKGKVPSYLGSSFAFIAPMVAATSMHSIAVASGGIIVTGAALAIVGFIVHKAGTAWIHAVMPPAVMGTILALIGLNLAEATTEGMVEVPLTTFGTTAAVIITAVLFRGFLGRLSILLGIVVGYLLALAQQQIDFQPVTEASWIGLPAFHAPEFQFDVLFLFLPVVFVLVAENIGHVRTVGLMTRSNLDPHNGRALIADGLATMLSGSGGGVGTTTYAANIGVMASSRIHSTAAYRAAGIVAMSMALLAKFGALIATMPTGVAAGAGIMLYGMIGIVGARIWVNNEVDFSNTINLMAAGSGLIIAIADPVVEVAGMQFGGIALGTLAALGIYHLMTAIARWRNTEPIEEDDFEAVEPGRIG